MSAVDWGKTVFLHIGWTSRYDGTEVPEGGHAYLKNAVGVEAENFRPVDGWCYGYAPVTRTREGRRSVTIPKGHRTLNITKLGANQSDSTAHGVTVIWTARHPFRGPVIVGLYDEATVYRFMPMVRLHIAKARVESCHLVPEGIRDFQVTHKVKGFPGMAAAWFPQEHQEGPAKDMLAAVAGYLPTIRRYTYQG